MTIFSSLLFIKVFPLEKEVTNVLFIKFACIMYPKLVQLMLNLRSFNSPSSFYVGDCSFIFLHNISFFLSSLSLVRNLDIFTFDNFRASSRLFFLFSTVGSLLNNFLLNFLTFTTSLHNSS
jgi:hypothetical protein